MGRQDDELHWKWREERFFAVAGISDVDFEVRREVELRSVRRVDAIMLSTSTPSIFQPLRSVFDGRPLVVEHYGSRINVDDARRLLSVSVAATLRHKRAKRQIENRNPSPLMSGSGPPLTVAISPLPPKSLCSAGIMTEMEEFPGVWRGLGPFAELFCICVYELALAEPGWDLLRWAYPPPQRADTEWVDAYQLARGRIADDEHANLSQRSRIALQELLMSEEINMPLNERESVYQRTLRQGREQGREEGRLAALMKLVSTVASAEELAELEQAASPTMKIEQCESLLRAYLAKAKQ